MLVVGDDAYRLNEPKGMTARAIESKAEDVKEGPAAQAMAASGWEGDRTARDSNG